MRVLVTLDLELESDHGSELLDTWAWALERQVEELELVKRATVVDLTINPSAGGAAR